LQQQASDCLSSSSSNCWEYKESVNAHGWWFPAPAIAAVATIFPFMLTPRKATSAPICARHGTAPHQPPAAVILTLHPSCPPSTHTPTPQACCCTPPPLTAAAAYRSSSCARWTSMAPPGASWAAKWTTRITHAHHRCVSAFQWSVLGDLDCNPTLYCLQVTAAREVQEESHGLVEAASILPLLGGAPQAYYASGRYICYLVRLQEAQQLPAYYKRRVQGGKGVGGWVGGGGADTGGGAWVEKMGVWHPWGVACTAVRPVTVVQQPPPRPSLRTAISITKVHAGVHPEGKYCASLPLPFLSLHCQRGALTQPQPSVWRRPGLTWTMWCSPLPGSTTRAAPPRWAGHELFRGKGVELLGLGCSKGRQQREAGCAAWHLVSRHRQHHSACGIH
jgi:hypothetical protein